MVDKTICKFRCDSVKHFGYANEVTLHAQYDETLDEDRRFSKATPSGNITFMVTNPNIFDFFVPGKCYYLNITPAD